MMNDGIGDIRKGSSSSPSEPLPLAENQSVKVTVFDLPDPADAWLDDEYMAAINAVDESVPTLEEVWCVMSKTSGNL